MKFLTKKEASSWCRKHRLLTSDSEPKRPPEFVLRSQVAYAQGKRSGREAEVAKTSVESFGDWTECLLWVTAWGIWPSGEDWPSFYAAREALGDTRSINDAPAQLFHAGEKRKLIRFVTMAMENAWDAYLLPATGLHVKVFVEVSHDEFVDAYARPD